MYKRHIFRVNGLAWSPDSQRIASAGGSRIEVLEAITGTQHFSYRGHTAPVKVVVWSPNGTFLASGDESGMVHIWTASAGIHLLTLSGQAAPIWA